MHSRTDSNRRSAWTAPRRRFVAWSGLLLICPVWALPVSAQQGESAEVSVSAARYAEVVDRGIEYLRSRGQGDDGAFSGQTGTGVTSVCLTAILRHRPAAAVADPVVQKGLRYLESNVRPDGGIYSQGSLHRNYETCLAMVALAAANREGRYDETLERAEAFIKQIQWDEGEGIDRGDPYYGGAGYGSHKRPDLSNTSFMIEALREIGRDADDEAIQRALVFVSRSQNLESPHNDTSFAPKVDDGGFYYTPAAGGQSMAGQNPDGGLRSYGSMTYAGLKSMIYAGLDKSDRRVEAALEFIRSTYSLEQNPGMGTAGLYYYYNTFAKALDVAGLETVEDAQGDERPWRVELFEVLSQAQQPDGSWLNDDNPRWMEGDRQLVTGYALLALAHVRPAAR